MGSDKIPLANDSVSLWDLYRLPITDCKIVSRDSHTEILIDLLNLILIFNSEEMKNGETIGPFVVPWDIWRINRLCPSRGLPESTSAHTYTERYTLGCPAVLCIAYTLGCPARAGFHRARWPAWPAARLSCVCSKHRTLVVQWTHSGRCLIQVQSSTVRTTCCWPQDWMNVNGLQPYILDWG